MTPDERIAELEARLAMVVEAAIQYRRSFNQSGQGIVAVNQAIDAACELCKSIEATAPAVAAFLQRVERRGAAKELESLRSWIESEYDPTPGSPNESIDAEILRRIEGLKYRAELERP